MVAKIAKYVKKYLTGTKIGDYIVNFVRIRGIDEKLYIWNGIKQYKQDRLNPTEGMIKTKQYYLEHKDEIRRIAELLADKKSKQCYYKAISYRYTHDRKKAPQYTKDIYFPTDIIHLSEDEVFIDGGGAFVGDTIRKFYKKTRGRYKKIVAFEPDDYNYKMLAKLKYINVKKFKCGLWDDNCELHFTNGGGCGSKITDNPDHIIQAKKMDDINECQNASYIKLDIEGAELKALIGAKKIIQRNHPKLAICLYHSDEDMIRIIEYINKIEPNYLIYIRHHSIFATETVMYAVYKSSY